MEGVMILPGVLYLDVVNRRKHWSRFFRTQPLQGPGNLQCRGNRRRVLIDADNRRIAAAFAADWRENNRRNHWRGR